MDLLSLRPEAVREMLLQFLVDCGGSAIRMGPRFSFPQVTAHLNRCGIVVEDPREHRQIVRRVSCLSEKELLAHLLAHRAHARMEDMRVGKHALFTLRIAPTWNLPLWYEIGTPPIPVLPSSVGRVFQKRGGPPLTFVDAKEGTVLLAPLETPFPQPLERDEEDWSERFLTRCDTTRAPQPIRLPFVGSRRTLTCLGWGPFTLEVKGERHCFQDAWCDLEVVFDPQFAELKGHARDRILAQVPPEAPSAPLCLGFSPAFTSADIPWVTCLLHQGDLLTPT